MSMFYAVIQMYGQLKVRDSLLILVTGIWLFDLHPKLQEKKLSKIWRRLRQEKRENFSLWKLTVCDPSSPLLKFLACTIPKNRYSDPKICRKTKEHKFLSVDKEMTKSIPASSLHMRELNRAILTKHLHMHVYLHSYTNVQINIQV